MPVQTDLVGRSYKRVSNEEIIEAYAATRSVWKAAKRLGLCGQSVHERLKALNIPLVGNRRWTREEDDELIALLDKHVTVGKIASQLGRTFAGVACRMNYLNVTVKAHDRRRKLPRASGYDKASVLKAMKAIELSRVSVRKYARANGLSIDMLVYAFGEYCSDRWHAHVAATSLYPTKECPNCKRQFIPMTTRQICCTRQCSNTARIDRNYFGGNRNKTIGLAEGICQLCSRKVSKGLSSHHVLGKENDPGNDLLIALCQGCHKLVGLIATRLFIDDSTAWETLIALAIMRRDGPKIAAGEYSGNALFTCVEIKWAEEYGEDIA